MKIKFQIWRYFSIFLLTIALFSCQKEESVSQSPLQTQQLENFIDKTKATEIASEFVFDIKAKNSNETNFLEKEVSEVSAINDEEQNTVFYIINYKDGGFLILAADNRSIPVLAYSDTETFDMSAEYYPSGLVQWLTDTKEDIKYLRENNIEQTIEAKVSWTSINAFHQKVPPIEGEGCENEYEQVDRLLSTKWDQTCDYNTYLPVLNCNFNCNVNNAYAGCVPVAIAQVMKYHQYPISYNWSNMPLGPTGNTTIAALIKDIHDQINFPFPIVNYECGGTGVDTDYDTAGLFRNRFGYSTATRGDYNSNTIKQQLRANRPVILQGGRNANWWIFNNYEDGHMWVCDGFKSSKICMFDDNGNPVGAVHYLYYRMNWGWGGEYNDAWYANNNFNPGFHTFNFQKKMIYNIKP